MKIRIFDFLSKHVSDYKISYLIQLGGPCGLLLLFRPVLYALLARRRDLSDYGDVDFSALIFIVYALVGGYVAVRELIRTDSPLLKFMFRKSGLLAYMLFTVLSFVSVLWSVDPILSVFRAFECLVMLLLIVATINRLFEVNDFQMIIEWSMLWAALECVLSILRSLSYTTNIVGILQTNQMFAPFFFYMALYRFKKKLGYYLVMLFSLLSMSTIAYIGMALGLVGLRRVKGKLKNLSVLLLVAVGISMIVLGPRQFLKDTLFFDKEDISLEQTTGRDHLMYATFDCMAAHPQGLGFFAGEPYYLYARSVNGINAHNAVFSAIMGCGILGGVIMSAFLVAMFLNVRSRYIHGDYRPLMLSSFCVAIVECMGNPSIGSRVYGAWMGEMFIFCLIAAFYCYGKYLKDGECAI